jgi:DNA-binding CsgD family transcriptional regulator
MEEQFIRGSKRNPGTSNLTLRQREVLQLLGEGYSMKQTAAILNVTPRTVAFHKYSIMQEYQLKSNADLLRFAIQQGTLQS